jgi:hypothetical protein
MRTVELSDLTLKELARMAGAEAVVVMHERVPVYVVIPLGEADYEAWVLSENPDFMTVIERARERFQREGGVPLDEVRRQLGLAD